MKDGAQYAKRVREFYKRLRTVVTTEPPTEATDPLDQLVYAQLSWDAAPANAHKARRKLTEQMIDLNEVRVSTSREIAAVIREFVPNPMECARSISRSLNAIFDRENFVGLARLGEKGRREARQYLESLDGVNSYVSASVLLWSLGAHAIPVNQRLLRGLKKEQLVDPDADAAAVQAFLERHVAASEAKTFCRVMEKLAAQKGAPPPMPKTGKGTSSESQRKKAPAGAGSAGQTKKAARR